MIKQTRTHCTDCSREWVYKTPDAGPEANCPICGSPNLELITFNGLFDSATPFNSLDFTTPEEDANRQKLVGTVETSQIPPTLCDQQLSWPPNWLDW